MERRLPFQTHTHLSFHINVELLDTLQGKLFFLHQDANRIPHELLGHLQHFSWHGGREQNHLRETGQEISIKKLKRQSTELNVALHLEMDANEH